VVSVVEVWPPPPGPLSRHEYKRILGRDEPRVRCRLVRLWGRDVWVDDEGRVWCPSCKQLVEVVELGRVDNGHAAIGLPFRAEGQLLPVGDEPGRRRRDDLGEF
jgi:hypothetical protein